MENDLISALKHLLAWLSAAWPLLLWLLLTLLNAASKHYSQHRGLKHILFWLTEIVSVLKSADAIPGSWGHLKWPLVDGGTGKLADEQNDESTQETEKKQG